MPEVPAAIGDFIIESERCVDMSSPVDTSTTTMLLSPCSYSTGYTNDLNDNSAYSDGCLSAGSPMSQHQLINNCQPMHTLDSLDYTDNMSYPSSSPMCSNSNPSSPQDGGHSIPFANTTCTEILYDRNANLCAGEYSDSNFSHDLATAFQACSTSPGIDSDGYHRMYFTDISQSSQYYDSDDSGSVELNNSIEEPSFPTAWPTSTHTLYRACSNQVGPVIPHIESLLHRHPARPTHRRGRPVTYKKPGYNFSDSDGMESDEDNSTYSYLQAPTRCRRGAKNILLWKFLLEELTSKEATHVQWLCEREGTFKFVDTTECSKRWGQKKKKDDMNFEKLSRGIRHYYRDGLMSRVDGTRLVYKFNWDRVPRNIQKRHGLC